MHHKLNYNQPADTKYLFHFTLIFLLIDYGRPQDLIPAIGSIRPSLIMVTALTVLLLRHNGVRKSKCNQMRMMWYFCGLLALLIPFATNSNKAYQTTLTMVIYLPFMISVIMSIDSCSRLKFFMRLYIGIMIYVSLYAMTHGGVGSGNYFSDENDVALYINTVLPFCFFLYRVENSFIGKLLCTAGLIVGLLAVIVSFSRGGFVGLVVIFFTIWLFSSRKLLTFIIIISLSGIGYFFSDDSYKQEMSTVTDTEDSTADQRLKMWATGWDMFLDNPLGVGGGNFRYNIQNYQGDRFKRGMYGRPAHSIWFSLLPELGVFGLLIFFSLLKYNIISIISLRIKNASPSSNEKYLHAMSLSFTASLAGYFASASFLSVLYYAHYWYLTALIVASYRIKKHLDINHHTKRIPN